MAKITVSSDGKLLVPNNPTIPFIEGDGIGKDIWPKVKRILDKAIEVAYSGSRKIEWLEVLAGEKSFNQVKSWLPPETMDAFKEYLVGIKGPLTTPVGGGIRSLNVALRQELDLFACIRPVRWFKGVHSPIIYPQKVDMTIFRENTEDIYAGIEWDVNTEEVKKVINFLQNEMGVTKIRFPETSAIGIKPVSKEGSTRLVRAAIEYAIENKKTRLTIVHKGNIMKFTEGGFKNWGYDLLETEFKDYVFTVNQFNRIKKEQDEKAAKDAKKEAEQQNKIYVDDVICDAFLQNTLLMPDNYQVIATLNLNGDYVSDQLAAMVGGIGIAPGGNINYKTGHAIFEATHGTAPLITGQDKANPCSMLLSGVLLLEYLGWNEAAVRVTTTLENLFEKGIATGDLASFMPNGKPQSTSEFTDHVISSLK